MAIKEATAKNMCQVCESTTACEICELDSTNCRTLKPFNEIMKAYAELNEKCDRALEKIKQRKGVKSG